MTPAQGEHELQPQTHSPVRSHRIRLKRSPRERQGTHLSLGVVTQDPSLLNVFDDVPNWETVLSIIPIHHTNTLYSTLPPGISGSLLLYIFQYVVHSTSAADSVLE